MFNDKVLLITGGTGSFGNVVLNRFIETDIAEIRVFSRDEKKQDEMRHAYQSLYPQYFQKIRFYIGDVRDLTSIRSAMVGVNYVFHAAALKQVPSCEFFPMEAVKTNVLGTDNVLSASIDEKVETVICLSTDKAAYPVNAMGTSKAMMEKIVIAKSRISRETKICCTRYGNVLCSRGSVVPLFINQIKAGMPITITDPEMTRFIMTLDEAVNLVMFAFDKGNNGDLLIQQAPSCTIGNLAEALLQLFGAQNPKKIIGTRHGEKQYEVLMIKEEASRAEMIGDYYRIPADNRNLNYDKQEAGSHHISQSMEYTSNNTRLLTIGEIKEKLMSTDLVQQALKEM